MRESQITAPDTWRHIAAPATPRLCCRVSAGQSIADWPWKSPGTALESASMSVSVACGVAAVLVSLVSALGWLLGRPHQRGNPHRRLRRRAAQNRLNDRKLPDRADRLSGWEARASPSPSLRRKLDER